MKPNIPPSGIKPNEGLTMENNSPNSYLDWATFKSTLDDSNNISVSYIDEEGEEIPIENDCQFQEALRLAKLFGNSRLRLVLHHENHFEIVPVNGRIVRKERGIDSSRMSETKSLEKSCQCNDGEGPPQWFTQYMDKFRKELVLEVQSTVRETIQSALKKEKDLETRLKAFNRFCQKLETSTSLVWKNKKTRRLSEKDSDLREQREVKVCKKSEKLLPCKLESRLEKLDNKTRLLLPEEKRKLLEKKRHSKSRLEKNSGATWEKRRMREGKSAAFPRNELKMHLRPGSEFTITLSILNNGRSAWVGPLLECPPSRGFAFKQRITNLPKLKPGESGSVTLKGKVGTSVGLFGFKCRLYDSFEQFGPAFTCWAFVSREPGTENNEDVDNVSLNVEFAEGQTEAVGPLIDLEKDVIANSQKKIEENIIEIEKRLHDIDLLRTEDPGTKNPFGGGGCDLLQDLVDAPDVFSKGEELASLEEGRGKKDEEFAENSDSELSVINVPEDEENFIVIPLPFQSPTPDSGNEDAKSQEEPESREELVAGPSKTEEDIEEKTEAYTEEDSSLTRSPNCPFEEEALQSRTRKRKLSESTNGKLSESKYAFTTVHLTQPTFVPQMQGAFGERPSPSAPFVPQMQGAFGERPSPSAPFVPQMQGMFGERPSPSTPFTFTAKKDGEKAKMESVPRTDASGKVIYAVNSNGFCFRVDSMLEEEETDGARGGRTPDSGKQSGEVPAFNNLPNAFMNGASNMASFAFNTAKSVINNLQSAFVAEGKTEMGKPAYETKNSKVSMEAMYKLYEMGFVNFQMNRKLLIVHDNNLAKVVEELVLLNRTQSGEFTDQ